MNPVTGWLDQHVKYAFRSPGVLIMLNLTADDFPLPKNALQGCGLKQSAAHLIVVSKGPLQGSPHSLFTFWSGSKSRIFVAHLWGWLRMLWPLRLQGEFVVDFLGGEPDSFLGCFQHRKTSLQFDWEQAFYKHFPAFGFKMVSKGSWRHLQHHRQCQQKRHFTLQTSPLGPWLKKIHSLKKNSSPLKINGWKMKFLFGMAHFQGLH